MATVLTRARRNRLWYLGLRLVIAKSYARIHWQNLVQFDVLPLACTDPAD